MDSVVYYLIGEKLKKVRLDKGLTQEDISKIIDCSKASIANYEKGVQAIYISDIYNIAIHLGLDINDFIPTNNEVKERLPEAIIKASVLPKNAKSAIANFVHSKKGMSKK